MTDTTQPRVAIVLPARNESGALPKVLREIAQTLADVPHEIIVVDDGSTDATQAVLAGLRASLPQLRVLQNERSLGQSAAIRLGVVAARTPLIGTLDADGQNPPAELRKVLAPLLAVRDGRMAPAGPGAGPLAGPGLVQGQRQARQDTGARRLASRLANAIRGRVLADGVRDSACGLKAFPRDVYLALPYFDHIHRFMPAMVRREGYEVALVDVAHAPRRTGASNYTNLSRALVGLVDLAGAAWLLRRRRLGPSREVPAVGDTGAEAAPMRSGVPPDPRGPGIRTD